MFVGASLSMQVCLSFCVNIYVSHNIELYMLCVEIKLVHKNNAGREVDHKLRSKKIKCLVEKTNTGPLPTLFKSFGLRRESIPA